MGTPYEVIYDAYLSKIRDDLYTAMDSEELALELQTILKEALPRFLYSKVSLELNEDGFVEELNNEEIQIVSTLMKLVWIDTQIHSIEVTRQVYRDQDFQLTSQASHLRALLTLKDDTKASCRELMHSYSKVVDRKPDFSGLSSRRSI